MAAGRSRADKYVTAKKKKQSSRTQKKKITGRSSPVSPPLLWHRPQGVARDRSGVGSLRRQWRGTISQAFRPVDRPKKQAAEAVFSLFAETGIAFDILRSPAWTSREGSHLGLWYSEVGVEGDDTMMHA